MIAPPVRAPWDEQRFEKAPLLGEHSDRLREEFQATAAQNKQEEVPA
jgi:crotonobetainyl-CoA:carnitine CoA-transferase CaiB-like acyl-CoA transferase